MHLFEYSKSVFRVACTTCLVAVALQGCLASGVTKPVKASDKVSSGVFDGRWDTVIKSTASTQKIAGSGNWTFSCTDLSGQRLPAMIVKDGEATLNFRGVQYQAYLNDSGQFRFEMPMSEVASESSRSDSAISNGKMTFILYGSLERLEGFQTFGVAQFANAGCTSKTTIAKI